MLFPSNDEYPQGPIQSHVQNPSAGFILSLTAGSPSSMSSPDMTITAPFTPEQVESLNRFQRSGEFHPFTCGGNRSDEAHVAYAKEHGDPDYGLLVATPDGWVCPVCDYKQGWAHDFMAGLRREEYMIITALDAAGVEMPASGVVITDEMVERAARAAGMAAGGRFGYAIDPSHHEMYWAGWPDADGSTPEPHDALVRGRDFYRKIARAALEAALGE